MTDRRDPGHTYSWHLYECCVRRRFSCIAISEVVTLFGSESDALGVAAEYMVSDDCNQDTTPPLTCLPGFKGGYCGLSGCMSNADCPDDAICVTPSDMVNYCFRTCIDKIECNENRTVDNEVSCPSNITRTDGGTEKACVPASN